ncbi:hypothetical protein Tsp_10284, partial [Trichinella spiralis]|uniref:hypothetical protein n=1 Tax=Trichinella spiralis TaxID=6334 RepID=UPI0001EFE1BA
MAHECRPQVDSQFAPHRCKSEKTVTRLVNVDNADTVVDVSEPACRVRIQQCTVVTYVVNVLCRCCELPLFWVIVFGL